MLHLRGNHVESLMKNRIDKCRKKRETLYKPSPSEGRGKMTLDST